jgi:hypothetical protein
MCAVVMCSKDESTNNRLQESCEKVRVSNQAFGAERKGYNVGGVASPTHLDRYSRKNYESLLQQWLNTSPSASVDDWHSSLDATMATRVSFTVILAGYIAF